MSTASGDRSAGSKSLGSNRFGSGRTTSISLALIAPFFLWGTAMVAMKGTIEHTTPLFLATVRLLPAGVLVLLAGAYLGRSQPQGWRAWLGILGFALVDGTCFQGFLAEGLARTSAGLGSVMIDSQPLAVALMAWAFFGEAIGLWGALGLLLGLVGISLLGLPEAWITAAWSWGTVGSWGTAGSVWAELLPAPDAWLAALFDNGQWLMLLASLSMAGGTVVSRVVSRWVDPIMATGWHMVLGALPLLVGSLVQETGQWSQLGLSDGLALAYATVFGSAIAYGLFFYFAASGSLTSLSALTFLTPIFALLFGMIFLQETLSPLQWGGVGLTLGSIYLINQREVLQSRFGRKLSLQPEVDATPERSEPLERNPSSVMPPDRGG